MTIDVLIRERKHDFLFLPLLKQYTHNYFQNGSLAYVPMYNILVHIPEKEFHNINTKCSIHDIQKRKFLSHILSKFSTDIYIKNGQSIIKKPSVHDKINNRVYISRKLHEILKESRENIFSFEHYPRMNLMLYCDVRNIK
jgi:hypothetical protein